MKISVAHSCRDFDSYRAARVKSLFNVESGCEFRREFDLPFTADWKLGVIVGPSGSGKTSCGARIFEGVPIHDLRADWPERKPIIDAIAPAGSFDAATAALSAVGLGDVPAWLRPFHVLSNGEQFRAGLARVLCDAPARVVIDEFTSVVDRQIAKIGAHAFAKAWRRTYKQQAVLLSCHYDILEWIEPDWVLDTATGRFTERGLWRRPRFELSVHQTDWRFWPMFEPHHYLKLPRMIAASCYVGTVDGEPVCHVAVSPKFQTGHMRACRLVVMPEWQGAGVGTRFLDAVCEHQLKGGNRWGRKCMTLFHTSHPGLAAALRRSPRWVQTSAVLFGGNKLKSAQSIEAARLRDGRKGVGTGYGGHFRAVQGFKYIGAAEGMQN